MIRQQGRQHRSREQRLSRHRRQITVLALRHQNDDAAYVEEDLCRVGTSPLITVSQFSLIK